MAEFKDKVQDAVQSAEVEVKRLIRYLNDEIVPKLRKEGGEALGAAAEQLRELAEKLEKRR